MHLWGKGLYVLVEGLLNIIYTVTPLNVTVYVVGYIISPLMMYYFIHPLSSVKIIEQYLLFRAQWHVHASQLSL